MPATLADRADIELLLEIAQRGSLIKAAESLRIHHATAFRRLTELERRIGQPLFDRLARGYVATPLAGVLLNAARRVRAEFHEFDAHAMTLDGSRETPLRVTTSDGLASAFFPALLRDFNAAHPDIVIELVVENRILNLIEREVDVALRPAREVSGDIVCRKVARVGYSLYASREYLRRHGRIDPEAPDFRDHRICAYTDSLAYFTTAKWLGRYANRAHSVVRSNSLTAMAGLARCGMCVAALPCVLGDGDRELVALLPPIAAMETSLWLCTHKQLRKVARVRAFLDFIYAAIVREQARLAGAAG